MNVTGLLDYQVEPAKTLHAALTGPVRAAVDASDMGIGKTAHALAVIRELDWPTLVLVPAVAIPGWKDMAGKLGNPTFDLQSVDLIRAGNTPWGHWENPAPKKLPTFFKCTACQCKVEPSKPFPCPHHSKGIHCVEAKKIPHNYGKFHWHPGIKLLVVDEAHRFSAPDSLNGDMLIAAKRQGIPTLIMSATIADSPMNLRAIGYLLGLHKLTDFYGWIRHHGCMKLPLMGFHFCVAKEKQKEILAGLHAEIFPRLGCRVRIKDLGDKFPECQITSQLFPIAEPEVMARLYREMAEEIPLEDPNNPATLARFIALDQKIELLKIPILVELCNSYLAEGRHVAVFVVYRASVDALCKRLKTDCRIDGSQTGERGARERAHNVAEFQADREPVIVGTLAAGSISIGLHDLHGNFPRAGLVTPGHVAIQLRQFFGRLPRQGSKSKPLYRNVFADGIEEEIRKHRALSGKLDCLDALNDGDLNPLNLPLTDFPGWARL